MTELVKNIEVGTYNSLEYTTLSCVVIRCWINIMPAYDDIVVESQFILASEAAEATAVFIVTDNKGYIDIICSLVSKLVRKLGKRKKYI